MGTLVKVIQRINAAKSPTGKVANPGDWIEIINQNDLRKWLTSGVIELPFGLTDDAVRELIKPNCAIVITHGDVGEKIKGQLDRFEHVKITKGPPQLTSELTLIWDARLPLSIYHIAQGYGFVQKTKGYNAWEMAAAWAGPTVLANTMGPKAERQKTREVVGDARLPLYMHQAMWVRKTEMTERIITTWSKAIEEGEDPQHSFLRTVFTLPLKLCTLPESWLYVPR